MRKKMIVNTDYSQQINKLMEQKDQMCFEKGNESNSYLFYISEFDTDKLVVYPVSLKNENCYLQAVDIAKKNILIWIKDYKKKIIIQINEQAFKLLKSKSDIQVNVDFQHLYENNFTFKCQKDDFIAMDRQQELYAKEKLHDFVMKNQWTLEKSIKSYVVQSNKQNKKCTIF